MGCARDTPAYGKGGTVVRHNKLFLDYSLSCSLKTHHKVTYTWRYNALYQFHSAFKRMNQVLPWESCESDMKTLADLFHLIVCHYLRKFTSIWSDAFLDKSICTHCKQSVLYFLIKNIRYISFLLSNTKEIWINNNFSFCFVFRLKRDV